MTYQFGDIALVRFPFTDQSATQQRETLGKIIG